MHWSLRLCDRCGGAGCSECEYRGTNVEVVRRTMRIHPQYDKWR